MAAIESNRRLTATTLAIFLGALLAAGCGGGGAGGDPDDSPEDLYVVTFSVPDFSGIFLNEQVSFTFSDDVKKSSVNFDSIRIRTGPNGGVAPRGGFVRGTYARGRVNTRKKNVVTFLPAVPNRVDLTDTGYAPAATYTVVVPAWPELNTVQNWGNEPVVQIFASKFTTLPSNAPQLFLDSDFPGSPDVVGITPANAADDVPVTASVRITFSEPLLPSTVIPTDPLNPNIALLNISSSPPQLIPVSYFLAQTRDLVTVTLNPLQPLEEGRVYRVIVQPLVTDLVGNPVAPFDASFATGGQPPPPEDFDEPFSDNFGEDTTQTTANWNNRFDTFVGGSSGLLTAVFAPFAGDGADGTLTIGPGQTVTLDTGSTATGQRTWRYTSVDVQVGGTLKATGDYALVLQCQGSVNIAGIVDLTGGAGGTGVSGDGTQNETSSNAGDATGGVGGMSAPGAGAGGAGGNTTTGTAGSLAGQNGFGDGGGHGGYSGDWQSTSSDPNAVYVEGGGGGGHGGVGENASQAQLSDDGDGEGGTGGPAYGRDENTLAQTWYTDATLVDTVPMLTLGEGGSGGGGGGSEDDSGLISSNPPNTGVGDGIPANDDEGGGGGGSGGGAFQVLAYGDISVTGAILCRGGRGGDTEDPSGNLGQGEAGGGGSGGTIWLQAYGEVSLASGAGFSTAGGVGGNFGLQRPGNINAQGGGGASGYIRFEDSDGVIDGLAGANLQGGVTTGTYSPSLALDSLAYSTWFDTRRASPRYGFPTEEFQLNGGTVVIEYQSTVEDSVTPGPNPSLDPDDLTPWVTANAIESIANRQWVRFRVRFNVPEDHPFTTPFPWVDRIIVPITF